VPLEPQQLLMSSLLDHATLADEGDLVGVADGGEPVCHDDGGSLLRGKESVQCSLHHALALVVECRSGLVEQQNRRVLKDCARNGNALLLPTGELPLRDACLEPVGEEADEPMCVGRASCLLHVSSCRIRPSVRNVLCDGAIEQHRLLPHQTDLLPQPLELERGDVHPVEQHTAGVWIVKALDQRNRSRFP